MKKFYKILLTAGIGTIIGIAILTVLTIIFTYVCKDVVYGFIIASAITGCIINYYLIEKGI